MGSRYVKCGVIALTLSYLSLDVTSGTGLNMAPHGKELSKGTEKKKCCST